MAGIDNAKEALTQLGEVGKDLKNIAVGGWETSDYVKLVGLAKDIWDTYAASKKALEAGEISDIDFSEIEVLFKQAMDEVSELMKAAV